MGLGLHGGAVAAIRFLAEAGAILTVTDIKSKEEMAPSIEKLKGYKNISFVFNQHRPEDFTTADIIIKNPAASWNNKYIKMALEKRIPVEMDSSLFFKSCANKIIGVTGTKGKTTTSALIYEILQAAGRDVIKVGVGQISVLDKLTKLKKDTIVVFELSSWRLSILGHYKLSPPVAVVTNIYQDHLNYYKSMEEYIADKKYIFINQKKEDFCVVNADNEILAKLIPEIKSQVIRFSRKNIEENKSVYINASAIYYNNGIDEKKVIDLASINIKGDHNLENVLAAIATALILEIDIKTIRKAISGFSGVPHRLEMVREVNGVKYVNDTAATTPEAAISGINSFSEPVILIAGGSDKKLDISEFAKAVSQKPKAVIFLPGVATDKILAALLTDKKYEVADSMEKAVKLAKSMAQSGDIVLLSPGAASFGLFLNEFDRGEKFRQAVRALK